jgi:hypothetical protein
MQNRMRALNRGSAPNIPDRNMSMASSRGSMPNIGSSFASKDTQRNIARTKFFNRDPSIPDDRIDRRMEQDAEERKFIDQYTKPVFNSVTGNLVSGLTQMTADAPMTLTQFRQQTANRLGPTMSEVFGDFGRGVSNFMGDLAEKGTPLMRLAKDIGGGILNFFDPRPGVPTMGQGPQFFDLNTTVNFGGAMGGMQSMEVEEYDLLNETQKITYNMLRETNGLSHTDAMKALGMATGGIATLQ